MLRASHRRAGKARGPCRTGPPSRRLLPRKLGRGLKHTLPTSCLRNVDFKQANKRKRFPECSLPDCALKANGSRTSSHRLRAQGSPRPLSLPPAGPSCGGTGSGSPSRSSAGSSSRSAFRRAWQGSWWSSRVLFPVSG